MEEKQREERQRKEKHGLNMRTALNMTHVRNKLRSYALTNYNAQRQEIMTDAADAVDAITDDGPVLYGDVAKGEPQSSRTCVIHVLQPNGCGSEVGTFRYFPAGYGLDLLSATTEPCPSG